VARPFGTGLNLAGVSIGQITVVKRVKVNREKSRGAIWECVCSCGRTFRAESGNLRKGNHKSCGCARRKAIADSLPDLCGRRYGKLTVVKRDGSFAYGQTRQTQRAWLCRCECGKDTRVATTRLTTGVTRSCGCLSTEHCKRLNNNRRGTAMYTPAQRTARYRERYPNRIAELRRRNTESLSDGYVAHQLAKRIGLRASDIPVSLIQAKRVHLKVKRLLEEIQR
jgi:hypothetical protein